MPRQQNGRTVPSRTIIVGSETLLGNSIVRVFREKNEKVFAWTSNLEQLGTTQRESFSNNDTVILVLGSSDERVKQAENVISAASETKVAAFILLSSLCADLVDTHAGQDYYPLEGQVRRSGLPTTILRIAPLMENLWLQAPHVRNSGLIFHSAPSHSVMNWIALDDVALAVFCVVRGENHTGQVHSLAAPEISLSGLAAAFANAKGRPVKYHRQTPKEYQESLRSIGVQPWEIATLVEYGRLAEADSVVTKHSTDAFKRITNVEPLSVEAWIKANLGPVLINKSLPLPLTFFTSQRPITSNGPKSIVVLHAETSLGMTVVQTLSSMFLAGITIRALTSQPTVLEQLELHGITVEASDMKQLQVIPGSVVLYIYPFGQASDELQAVAKVVSSAKSTLVLVSSILAGVQASEYSNKYRQVESIAKSVPQHTIVRVPVFLDEFLEPQITSLRANKEIIGPAPADFAMAFISLSDAAFACARILSNPTFHSKTFVVTAGIITLKDLCSTLQNEWAYDVLEYHTKSAAECMVLLEQAGFIPTHAAEIVACQHTQWVLGQDFADITGQPATAPDVWAASQFSKFGATTGGVLILQPNEMLSQVIAATIRSDHCDRSITIAGEIDDTFPVKTVSKVDLDWGVKLSLILQRSVVLLCLLEATDPLFLLTSLLSSIKATGKTSSLLVICAASPDDNLIVDALIESQLPFSLLKVPILFESIWGHVFTLQRDQIIYGSLDGDHPVAGTAMSDVATIALELLLNPSPGWPRVMTLRKSTHTGSQLASILSQSLGRNFAYAQVSQHVWSHELARSVCNGNQEVAEKLPQHLEAAGALAFDMGCPDAFEALKLPPYLTLENWVASAKESLEAVLASASGGALPRLAINASGGMLAAAIARAIQGHWEVLLGTRELDALDEEVGMGSGGVGQGQEAKHDADSVGVLTLVLVLPLGSHRVQYVQRAVEYALRAGMLSVVFISLIADTVADADRVREECRAMEDSVKASGLRYTILRIPNSLMDLNWCHVLQVLDRSEFKGVPNDDAALVCLSTKDVAFAVAGILREPFKYANRVFMQQGTQYTPLRLAEAFGNALGGRYVTYQQVDEAQYEEYIRSMDLTDKTAHATLGCYWPKGEPDCEVLNLHDSTTLEEWVNSVPLAALAREREDAKTEHAQLLVLIADTQEEVKQLRAKQREQERIFTGLLAQRAQQEARMVAAEQRYVSAKVKQETLRIRLRRQRGLDSGSQVSRRSRLSTSSA